MNNSTWFPNTTTTTTVAQQSHDAPQIDDSLRYTLIALCIMVIVLGILGNGLVLLVFGMKWSKLKSCEIFMFSLALADLLNATVAPSKMIFEFLDIDFFPIGHVGCKVISFLSLMTMTVSALTLLAVSIDRFIIVKWPLHERPYHRTIVIVIALTWIFSAGLASVYLIGDNIKLGVKSLSDEGCMCQNHMSPENYEAYSMVVFSIQNVIPIVIMTMLYTMIVIQLRRNATSGIFAHCKREMKLRMKQNKRVTRMVFIIVIVFYVCILPTHIFHFWYTHNHLQLTYKTALVIFNALTMLQMCNSIANPIIYSRLHVSFRRDTVKLILPCLYDNKKWSSMRSTTRSIFRSSSFGRRRNSSRSSVKTTHMSITSSQFHRGKRSSSSCADDMTMRLSIIANNLNNDSPNVSELSFFPDDDHHNDNNDRVFENNVLIEEEDDKINNNIV